MTRELFVVRVLRDAAWVDVAEFDDEDFAFMKYDELRRTEIVKVVRRCVRANPLTPGEWVSITSSLNRSQFKADRKAIR